jgi:hypothetical protein
MPRWVWALIIILVIVVFVLPQPAVAGANVGNTVDSLIIFFRNIGTSLNG